MNRSYPKMLALFAIAGCAGSVLADESVTYTGVNSMEAQGDGTNEHRTATLVGGFTAGAIRVSGTLTEINVGTFASEARMRITTPSGQILVLQPFTTAGFTGSVSVSDYLYNLASPEAAEGAWDIEFYESFNDGAGADAVWDTITLNFEGPVPPPANDDCGSAEAVVVDGTYPGNSTLATNEGSASCGTSTSAKDVWYSFTAPHDGEFSFSTCDAVGFDTVMSLWDACGGSELVCDDDTDFTCGASGLRSELHYLMGSGQSVLIRVSGYNGASGAFVLHVGEITPPPPPPANDECSGALPISNGANQAYDTTSATDSGIALAECGLPVTIHNDIYFAYTASCTGDVTVSLCGTTYDTVVAVYDACGGAQVACDDDTCDGVTPPGSGLASQTTFAASSGTTYIIAVGSYATGVSGAGVISLDCVPTVPTCPADFNDDGFLDFFDYDDYVNCFETGTCPPGKTGDFNGDGFADFFDYDDFVGAFEAGC